MLARDILGTTDPDAIAAQVDEHSSPASRAARCSSRASVRCSCSIAAMSASCSRCITSVPGASTSRRSPSSRPSYAAQHAARRSRAFRARACSRRRAVTRRAEPRVLAELRSTPDDADDPQAPRDRRLPAIARAEAARLSRRLAGRARSPDRTPAAGDRCAAAGAQRAVRFLTVRAVTGSIAAPPPRAPCSTRASRRSRCTATSSCANVRVVGGRVAAIFDIDSVCLIDEAAPASPRWRSTTRTPVMRRCPRASRAFPSRDRGARVRRGVRGGSRQAVRRAPERERLECRRDSTRSRTPRAARSANSGQGGCARSSRAAPDAYFDLR